MNRRFSNGGHIRWWEEVQYPVVLIQNELGKIIAIPFHPVVDPLRSTSVPAKRWGDDLGVAASSSSANLPTMQAKRTAQRSSSACLPFSSPAYCASMQSKRRVASLGASALFVSNVLPLDADELHGNHEHGDEIYIAALLISGDLSPRIRWIWWLKPLSPPPRGWRHGERRIFENTVESETYLEYKTELGSNCL